MADKLTTNAAVIAHVRANEGKVPAPYDDPPPMVLLHTIGAKSGREHIVAIVIELGTESVAMWATELSGAERDAVFARQAARFPIFADYARRLERTIPVIRLDRRLA